jgi:hypothetical protein
MVERTGIWHCCARNPAKLPSLIFTTPGLAEGLKRKEHLPSKHEALSSKEKGNLEKYSQPY